MCAVFYIARRPAAASNRLTFLPRTIPSLPNPHDPPGGAFPTPRNRELDRYYHGSGILEADEKRLSKKNRLTSAEKTFFFFPPIFSLHILILITVLTI
jgi:hypothetical protein